MATSLTTLNAQTAQTVQNWAKSFGYSNISQAMYFGMYTVFPHIVCALEQFSHLNSFRTFMCCDLWSYVL